MKINSAITFFYYLDLQIAADFYQEVMGFKLIEDQRWAKIFQISSSAFMGVVDGSIGFHKAKADNAVLLTLVADDIQEWYRYLVEKNVKILQEPKFDPETETEIFFCEDPGGYSIEIQKFHKPGLDLIFG